MSDYSFMKTGFNNVNPPNNISDKDYKEIESMLALFISNATVNGAKYVELCDRNGVTKEDIIYGLRYEVFEFLHNDNLNQDIQDMNDELDSEMDVDLDEDEIDNVIVDDNEIDPFSRIINLELLNHVDLIFVQKMHNYHDTWNSWIPDTPFLQLLKNSINKTM